MAVDFKKLLSKNVDEVKPPKNLPPGSYLGRVKGFSVAESRDKHTPYVQIDFVLDSAVLESIEDKEDLNDIDLSKENLNRKFFLTPKAEHMLKDFIASCGVQTAGKTWAELLPEINNAGVMLDVIQRPDTRDPMKSYNDISKVVGKE